MPYLTAAVIVLTVLLGLNLLLTFGVVRRLREHTKQLAELASSTRGGLPKAGSTIEQFVAETVDNRPISRDMLADGSIAAFFSPSCEPCKTTLPEFVTYATTFPGGRDRLLAVIVGNEDSADMVAALSPVARVVLDDKDEVAKAFGVQAFPTLCLLGPDHTIDAAAHDLSVLPTPVKA
ncbi:TlpA disulfide reductase family protein [Rhizohabitans arisaemae]|uniref:TlpA disulfide reductase family protein n=1 Tax=Rhizohabitans arisaemae TaxID=2720610 RepID=UPI0024B18F8C|nr:TlpA disulfide reductase family protein [Rhizohabitans arisaemae]